MQTYNGSGTNNLTVAVVHEGISNASKVFENSVSSTIVNHVYKRTYHGQSGDFFGSSISVVVGTNKMLGPKFIGQVKIGVMDVFLSKGHMIPMQWFAIVDPMADLPVEPLGFVKMNVTITTLAESMAVQTFSPDAIGDWDLRRMPPAILQVPRLNLRACACHQYNIKFFFYQGYQLGANRDMSSADPRVQVISACGQFNSDPAQATLSPTWNALLQCPFYEPNYMDLIKVEVHDAGAGARGGVSKMSSMIFSWKHIICNLAYYAQPRWIDMYELPPNLLHDAEVPLSGQSPEQMIEAFTGVSLGYAGFVEKSLYGGRLLMAIEVEERSFKMEPSPANIALKPKDCEDKWSDAKQKCLFRFQAFYGQGLTVDGMHANVRLEFSVGATKVMTKPKPAGDNTLFEWYEAVEMECEFPFDDLRDNPDGKPGKLSEGKGAWNPNTFLDNMPDTVIKVYRVDVTGFSQQLIGYWKGPTKEMLAGVGDPFAGWTDVTYVGTLEDENGTAGMMGGIQPIVIAPGDFAALPTKKAPFGDPEDSTTQKILNPYKGFQMQELQRDATCSLGPDDHAGFIAFSAKLWLPDRVKCANGPPKGPPILSPWKEWNKLPIPKPNSDYLQWMSGFQIRAHVYQAKNLQARNETGVTSCYFMLTYGQYPPAKTHTVQLTNNPTFDTTLYLSDLEMMMLPNMLEMTSVSWGGIHDYMVNAEDKGEVEDNQNMMRISPRIELACWEVGSGGGDKLLGRIYVKPEETLTRKSNPEWECLFRGDPEVEMGEVLCCFQVIAQNEKIMKEPPQALVPDVSKVTKEEPCVKAPANAIQMIESMIQIQVLGLRELVDPSPIKGIPFLKNPSLEISCDDPKTCCVTKPGKAPASDANFMECLEISVLLPKEAKFAPVLDFYIYDSPPFDIGFFEKVITGYGNVAMSEYYIEDDAAAGDEDNLEEEDEDAKNKRIAKEKLKKFMETTKELQKTGVIDVKGRKTLERFWGKKDEAVLKAFDQYLDAPEPSLFVERIMEFLGDSSEADKAKVKADKEKENKALKDKADKELKAKKDRDHKRKKAKDSEKAAAGDGEDEEGEGGEQDNPDGGEEGGAESGALDKGDALDAEDDEEAGDGGGANEAAEDETADYLLDEDDIAPDFQEEVDTADGKPNPEWMLLRAHKSYDVPLEEEPSKWAKLFDPTFDEVKLYRGQIRNAKQLDAEVIGILKCKIKVYQLEEISEGDKAKGKEAQFLDMAELKEGHRVPYEMPDIFENYPARNIEIRVYLLRAFQINPVAGASLDGHLGRTPWHKSTVKITLGQTTWEWEWEYEAIAALNPQFFRCAKLKAALPGPSQMKIDLIALKSGLVGGIIGSLTGDQGEIVGSTSVDLEDRWYCQEWQTETIHKPREVRDLYKLSEPGISAGKLQLFVDAYTQVDAPDWPVKDINIAGRQMPLELRIIVWNLKEVAPKDGYTSNVRVSTAMLGWGKDKETDTDCGVKTSRLAMFNYRLKYKGLKYPSPDPTFPAKDFLLQIQVWGDDFLGIAAPQAIAGGVLPLGEIFRECMQRNLGKPSPDDMEIVSVKANKDSDVEVDDEGGKYPFRWFKLCHPGGPGCKTNKNFKKVGYDFEKNAQAMIQLTVQVMPRALARATPASPGFKAGPAKLRDPNRPPQPANPIFSPDQCGAYIAYTCKEAISKCKPCCCCLICLVLVVALLVGYFYAKDILGLPPL